MATKNIESKQAAEVVTFTKEQILSAKKYMHNQDIVNVVLEKGQLYQLDEVDELIEKFMKEKVN